MADNQSAPKELRELARLRAEGLARRSEAGAFIGWDDGGKAWQAFLEKRRELSGMTWEPWE